MILGLVALALGVSIDVAQAQYFGRNRVQYEDFDFRVLETEHFDIHYYEGEAEAARIAGVMAERWYRRLSSLLSHELRGRQVIVYYANHAHFQQTNALGGTPGESTGGATEVFKRRIVLPFAGPLSETDHVLGHELVHAFQFDMTGQGKTISETNYPTALRLPLWFIEGMAEYLSVGPHDPHTAMWIRDAMNNDRLPNARQLYNPEYFPYRFGQALWAYVAGRWGDDVIGRILNAAGRRGTAEGALEGVLRVPIDSLIADWHESIRFAYGPLQDESTLPEVYGSVLLGRENSGEINIAPALSPDGSKVVFLSEKDGFAIEMFLADAETGEIIRKLIKTSVDPHFESLQFIYSAGAWASDNQRFVFGGTVKGKAVLSVMDTRNGKVIEEIRVDEAGEVLNPSWSPDGRYLVFSANVGGLSDLFLYDFEAASIRRLTNDVYADLQPAWAPDGRRVAFVTDRYSSNANRFEFGNYRLATWDLETGQIHQLPSIPGVKHINPQWSADGNDLFFVADRDGVSNIYRMTVASGRLSKVTNVFTGVSGITGISPVISHAANMDRMTFTSFQRGDYAIYRVDDTGGAQGEFVATLSTVLPDPADPDLPAVSSAGVLPPADREPGIVQTYLANSSQGLVDENAFGTEDYSPGLSLDFLSQPQLAFAVDNYGAYLGAGISAFWSDMLGGHNLATAFQIDGGVKDIGALVGYTNRTSRWNWGLVAGQTPYTSRYAAGGVAQDDTGRLVFLERLQTIRQYNREVSGIVAYPFSRVHRVELGLGVRNIGFSSELQTRIYDANTGELLEETDQDLETCFTDPRTFEQICPEGSLNMAQASLALVYDNSLFGGTSPVLGQRYRVELGSNLGGLNYFEGLADFRKYLMPVSPFTLAFRLTHFGRYGPDAEEPVLSDLYVGSQTLMRGYDYNSFTAQECASSSADDQVSCPVQDQLFGSRVAVASAELRFPLMRVLGLGNTLLGIPVEGLFFGDAGVAWESNNELWIADGDRTPVYSAGAGLRFNLFNFIIGEIDYVRPFQRPDKGWHWQFVFRPGF
jgi:Tol biopolymer transport system component